MGGTRLTLPLVIGAIVVVGGLLAWAAAELWSGRSDSPADANVALSSDGHAGAEHKGDDAGRPSGAGRQTASLPARAVNSYAVGDRYPLAHWSVLDRPSGFVDVVDVNGVPAQERPVALRTGDILTLSGWAGDRELGVRLPHVIVSACGEVLAHAAVDGDRPDVAEAIHPNLARSGWQVSVAAAHLSDCPDRTIRAWAVAPGNQRTAFALSGAVQVSGVTAAGPAATPLRSLSPPLLPEAMEPLRAVTVDLGTPALNMRRCGATDCAIVAQLKKGRWVGLVLDDRGDWALFALPDKAGWISKKHVKISAAP